MSSSRDTLKMDCRYARLYNVCEKNANTNHAGIEPRGRYLAEALSLSLHVFGCVRVCFWVCGCVWGVQECGYVISMDYGVDVCYFILYASTNTISIHFAAVFTV